jgi:serine/threonine-protein kinase HipA
MVTTPRPRCSAVLFAPSLLTITAGRRLLASAPSAGLMNGRRLGHVGQLRNGNLELVYDEGYREVPGATPLSTAMPLTAPRYRDRLVRPFLVGLLPDNDDVLSRWGQTFGVSNRNPLALLGYVGEDCAGAAQFVRPDRLDDLARGGIGWLDETDVEDRLRAIRLDPTAWLWGADEQAQFSLAGAQSKIALLREGDCWGRPHGRVPTSRILKVASRRSADQEITEQVTMRAARLAGLVVAGSELATFGAERAIVIERHDRLSVDDDLERVHQEDLCQALGLLPERKYQWLGGPGPIDIVKLLRARMPSTVADEAVARFVDALVFNWLVGGTDAHAKNYSLLMQGPEVRLAPLYDLTSGLPYRDGLLGGGRDSRKRTGHTILKMAMSIGGESYFSEVKRSNWESFATQAGVDTEWVLQRIHDLGSVLPAAVSTASSEMHGFEAAPVLDEIVDSVAVHVAEMMKAIDRPNPKPPAIRTTDSPAREQGGPRDAKRTRMARE